MADTHDNERRDLFEEIKRIGVHIPHLGAIIQNSGYTPSETEISAFEDDCDNAIEDLKEWKEKVVEYLRDLRNNGN